MFTFLSLVLGILAPQLPQILGLFSKTIDNKHTIEMLDRQHKYGMESAQFKAAVDTVAGIVAERNSARDHDSQLLGKSVFFDKMRSSIIPVLTYLFATMYFTMKGILIASLVMDQGIDLQTAARLVLDEDTTTFFSSIMAFWFGTSTPVQRRLTEVIDRVRT